jgi:hypothetical protein
MSSFPDEQNPSLPRRIPLGRLLVGRGLLTEEQLIEALLEQDRTGDRLGKVLIRLGFVDEPSVAMALASQHGGPLKTEYGFATGFPDGLTEPVTEAPDPAAPQALAERENMAESSAPERGSTATVSTIPAPAVTGLAGEIAEASDDTARINGRRDTALGVLQESTARRDSSWIDAAIAERDAVQAELDAAHARIAELEGELAIARDQLDERSSQNAELEDRVAGARVAAETAIAALRGVTEIPL